MRVLVAWIDKGWVCIGLDMYIFYWDVYGIIYNLDIYRMWEYGYVCTYGSIYNTLLNSCIIRSYSRDIYLPVKCIVKLITAYSNLPTPCEYLQLMYVTFIRNTGQDFTHATQTKHNYQGNILLTTAIPCRLWE